MDQDVVAILKKIGLEVADFRQRSHLTDEELASRLDMSVDKLKIIENGEVNISLQELVLIQKVIGFSWQLLD